MATIQFKRKTSTGTGPLVGSTGTVKSGEPLVDFSGGNLYIAKADKTASSSSPLATTDYLQIPGASVVDSKISTAISAQGLGTAAKLNTGTSSGQIPVLDSSGKLADAIIPKIAMTNTFVVATQAAMLALSTAQEGDVAVRTDLNKTFILKAAGYSTLANWQELLTPTDTVTSVNGKTGTVVITLSELGGASTTALSTHESNGRHLTDAQKEKLGALFASDIWENSGCLWKDDATTFADSLLANGLVMKMSTNTEYNMNRQSYQLAINKDAVLTPTSVIDGGTY